MNITVTQSLVQSLLKARKIVKYPEYTKVPLNLQGQLSGPQLMNDI